MIAQMSRIAKIIRRGMRELLRKPGDRARRAVDKLAMGKRLQWVHGPFAAIVAAGALGPVLPWTGSRLKWWAAASDRLGGTQ
jgi:hypothetical protein